MKNRKNVVRNLFLFEFRRKLWLSIVALAGLFAVLPVYFTQLLSNFKEDNGVPIRMTSEVLRDAIDDVFYWLTYNNGGVGLVLFVLAIINALVLYSFLASKKKLDFYLGQPVKRRDLFWITYIQGVLYAIVPYLICTLIVMLMALANRCLTPIYAYMLMQNFLVNSVFYLSSYSVVVLACCLTGRTIFATLGSGVLFAYFPFVVYELNEIVDGNLESICPPLCQLSNISPIIQYYSIKITYITVNIDFMSMKFVTHCYDLKGVASLLAFFLIGTIFSRLLFVRRRAESVGKVVVFKSAKIVIKAALVTWVTLSSISGFSFFFGGNVLFYRNVGLVIGIVVGIYLMDAIIELNWKASFENWKWQWVYVLIAATSILSFYQFSYQYRYNGFDSIPKYYTKEQAVKDGCVILQEGELVEGEELWNQFMEQVEHNKNAKVRIVEAGYDVLEPRDYVYRDGTIKEFTQYDLYNSMHTDGEYIRKIKVNAGEMDRERDATYYVLTDKKDFTKEDYLKQYNTGDYVAEELFRISD